MAFINMDTAIKIMLCYFNITGILSFKYENCQLKLSKRWFMWNFLTITLITIAKCTIPSSVLSKNLRQEPVDVIGVTTFLSGMLIIARFRLIITAPLCLCVSIGKFRHILRFIESCKKIFYIFQLSTSSGKWKKMKKNYCETLCLLITLSFFMRLTYFLCIFKTTWQAALIYLTFHWHNNIVYSLILFLSFFFSYFLFLLRCLNTEVKRVKLSLDYDLLSLKFLELHHLIKEFNETFGLLLSIVTEFIVFTLTFCVRLI